MANFGDIAANTTAAIPTAIPAGNIVGDTDTQTLTNKRINPRPLQSTNAASITPSGDANDIASAISQAQALTFNAPTGTPVHGQQLRLSVLDNGSAQNLTFNAIYIGSTAIALPATSLGSTTVSLWLTFTYDTNLTKWRLTNKAN